jgi:hypothetical protein
LRDDFAIVTEDDDDDDEEENFTLLLLLLLDALNRVVLVVTVVVDATDNMFFSVFNRKRVCACGTKYNLYEEEEDDA